MDNDYIEIKKKLNNAISKSHADSKLDYCLCCGKKCNSFCNSHSLPRFILANISDNGLIYNFNNYFKMPLLDVEKGLNNSGTFKRICNHCDKEIFKLYESDSSLGQIPRKKIMTQIDLKNSLRMYDKRLNEISLYNNMLSMSPNEVLRFKFLEKQRVNNLDLNEIKAETKRDLKILNKESSSSFELIYWKKLDYITPIAFQGHIALIGDLKGNIINDIYNKSENYVIENINICIFPLKSETVVMVFINKDNKKYNNFIKQFKKLNEKEKLKLIPYIIFNYSEDFYISKKAKETILDNKELEDTAQSVTDLMSFDLDMLRQLKEIKFSELLNYKKFPDILNKEFSLEVAK